MKKVSLSSSGNLLSLFAVLCALLLFSQCRKEKFVTDSSAVVEFSNDSILFDTVFTTVGSTTQILKVYNRNSDRISISRIELEGGNLSPYRINVDGVSGHVHTDVEIAGDDSLYIFVEVTLDPNNTNLPFVVEDRLLFQTNGNNQQVMLTAWGQDAYFHVNLDITNLQPLEANAIWNSDKPHVVYGITVVDSCNTLTITQGTQVHIHSGSGIWVRKGTITVQGELGNEVVFQGDRLEPFYQSQPGQWGIDVVGFRLGGLWLTESKGSSINYAELKNGIIGIQVDSVFQQGTPALTITNTIIQNMSAIGLYANSGADIEGHNNLIANCGQSCAAFLNGGSYRLDFCSFVNYWTFGSRQAATFAMSNWYEDVNGNIQVRPITNTLFRNCIMYGNNAPLNDFNEFAIDLIDEEFQDYTFRNCLVDNNDILFDPPRYFDMRVVVNNEQLFVSPFSADFHLRSTASVIDRGIGTGISTDLDGVFRAIPDIGCYEFQ